MLPSRPFKNREIFIFFFCYARISLDVAIWLLLQDQSRVGTIWTNIILQKRASTAMNINPTDV